MDAIGEYGGIRLDETRAIESVSGGYTYFRDGDVLVAKITPCFENGKGAIAAGLEKGVGFGTTELHVLRPLDGVDSRFLFYITISKPFRDAGTAAMIGAAGQKRVPEEFIQNFRVAVPALNDQRTIADFLDEKTAAIDALIAKKERLIELIEEKRQATITRAVTKGLDPDVPMREAQSEWLDRIPDHWKEMHLKRFIDMRSGSSITSAAIEESGKYPVYGGNGLRGFTSGYTHVGERVLIGRQGAHCGNVHRVSGRFWASEHAVVVTPRQPCSISWLSELLRAMNLNQYSIAAAQPGLAVERILMLHAPVPPVEDQKRIGDEVERVRASTDHFIVRASDQIAKLREYRQTLISAAVTGQLDVRSRTARALDPTAPEPLEEVLT